MKIYLSNYLLILLCSLSFVACKGKDKSFQLEGQIEGYSNGIAYLKQFNGENFACLDSTKIEKGHFTFSGEVDQTQLCRVVLSGHKYPIYYFFLEAGRLNYTAQLKGNRLTVPTIEGTVTQNEYARFLKGRDAIYRMQLTLRRQKFKDSVEKEKGHLQLAKLSQKMDSLKNTFLKNEKTPILSLYLLKESCGGISDYQLLEKQLKSFELAYSEHPLYLAIHKRMEALRRIAPGQPASLFEMESLEGTIIRLSDFQEKITLLDFWASWCGPCRRENPSMVKLYKEYHDKGLEIIGISLDNSRERWEKAVKKDDLTWNHVCDFQKWNCSLVEKYAVRGVPFTVLVDKQGRIIASGLHGTALKNIIKEALEIQ